MKTVRPYWLVLLIAQIVSACTGSKQMSGTNRSNDIKELRFIDAYEIPHNLQFNGTIVGGLSGIDYDPEKHQYYLISDDRSDINPARFYTAKIKIADQGIDTVYFAGVNSLLMANGNTYPNEKEDPNHTPDNEGLRYSTKHKQLIVSSEGERIVSAGKTVLEDPFIHWIDLNGQFKDSFALATKTRMQTRENGLRQNATFEGLTFADDFKSMFVSIEEPLYEDGNRATINDSGWIRLIKYDVASRKPIAEYAYRIDPIAHPPKIAGGSMNNGVSDILYLGKDRLLVVERSYSPGRSTNTVKVYIVDLTNATNVTNESSLLQASFQPVAKKLLLNMDTLNRHIDNTEGVCFGPTLKNGHQSLIFVTDNNFNIKQKTQFYLFEIIPAL